MRINAIFNPADCSTLDNGLAETCRSMFAEMFPGVENPQFDENHAGMAIAANSPGLALAMRSASAFMLAEMPFGKSVQLRELAIATVNAKLGSEYGLSSRKGACHNAGITDEMLSRLPDHRDGPFDVDQAMVVEYAAAVAEVNVSDDLLSRFSKRFGEGGAIECAALVGLWSCWAMIIEVGRP